MKRKNNIKNWGNNTMSEIITIRIRVDYYTDVLGKEISDFILSEYNFVLRNAKKMKVPEDDYIAYKTLVQRFFKINDKKYAPPKKYMEKNLKKFAKRFNLDIDLMPHFLIAFFDRFPKPEETLLDLVYQLGIEFVALMLLLKKLALYQRRMKKRRTIIGPLLLNILNDINFLTIKGLVQFHVYFNF